MSVEEEKHALSETGMTLKQLHHGLSDIFNINVRRIAAAFPDARYEDAEIYYIKGRKLTNEYNRAAALQNGFGATLGRGILKGAKYTAIGLGIVVLLGVGLIFGAMPSGTGFDLSEKEKRSLDKPGAYGAEFDRLRRNFAEDIQMSLAERARTSTTAPASRARKTKGPDLS